MSSLVKDMPKDGSNSRIARAPTGVKIAVLNDDMRDVISASERSKPETNLQLNKNDTQPALIEELSSRHNGPNSPSSHAI